MRYYREGEAIKPEPTTDEPKAEQANPYPFQEIVDEGGVVQFERDGNKWCAHRMPFTNMMETGFGDTPMQALADLIKQELAKNKSANTEHERKLETERDNWQQIAVWLADCQAATGWHYKGIKSASKSEQRRHLSICSNALTMLTHKALIGTIPSKLDEVIKRLEELVNDQQRGDDNG